MRLLMIITVMAALLSAQQASAGWERTRWGMSPKQVANTLAGLTEKTRDIRNTVKYQTLLTGIYSIEDLHFKVDFAFDKSDKLGAVSLVLTEYSKCDSLTDLLRAKYGHPDDDKILARMHMINWSDRKRSNLVSLLASGLTSACLVTYENLDAKTMDKL